MVLIITELAHVLNYSNNFCRKPYSLSDAQASHYTQDGPKKYKQLSY